MSDGTNYEKEVISAVTQMRTELSEVRRDVTRAIFPMEQTISAFGRRLDLLERTITGDRTDRDRRQEHLDDRFDKIERVQWSQWAVFGTLAVVAIVIGRRR